jgi:PAS domain S-box-containing protein
MEYGMVMASKEGRVVYWDDGASELFGYARADVMGRPVDVIVPGDLRAKHWEGFHRVMKGGERHLEGAAINLPVRINGGEVLAFPARFHHIDDPGGTPIGALAVFGRRTGQEQPWTPIEEAP